MKYTAYKRIFELYETHGDIGIFRSESCKGTEVWEVIKFRYYTKDKICNGEIIKYKGDLRLPSPSEWGSYGWSALSLDHAREIANAKRS